MIVFRALAFISSLGFHLQLTDGFSTVQPPAFRRSKNVELSSSFHRLSSTRTSVNGRSAIVQRNLSNLWATKDEGDGVEEVYKAEAAVDKNIAGRKKRLNMGYQLAAMAFAAAALFTLTYWGSLSASAFYYIVGGGPLTMSVILYILKGAASNDRLGSDTYKRLNIAVICYALVQLVIPTGTLGWPSRLSFKVPGFLALVNGIKGYGYGCLGWDKSKDISTVLTDAKEGIKSTLKGLTTVKAKSAGYMFGTLLVASMFCLKLKELCTMLFFSGVETATVASTFTRLSKLARFGLMTTIMYTLKDASDRDRLSGSTFVQLNFVAATAFLSIFLYLLPTYGKVLSNAQILAASGLCAMTFFKGVTNLKAKKE